MSELISRNCIVFDLDAAEKKDVIKVLVKELDAAGKITDQEEFFGDVLAREAIAPTYVGFDMGLPHGKTDHVIKEMCIRDSDQGAQYTSRAFVEFCESVHVTQSMSKAGYPYDNAPMERYFNT